MSDRRTLRYSDLLPLTPLINTPVTIVGCGAVGRALALQLAAMGTTTITLIDPDKVSTENLGPQGWSPFHLNRTKVSALASDLEHLNPDCTVTRYPSLFSPDHVGDPIVFMCVDSMDARQSIFNDLVSCLDTELIIEARMAAETFQVRTVSPVHADVVSDWHSDWFPDTEAAAIPCTARATIYCATMCASTMVARYTESLRNCTPPYLVSVNVLDGTSHVTQSPVSTG